MRESDTLLHWWLKTNIHIQLFSPSLEGPFSPSPSSLFLQSQIKWRERTNIIRREITTPLRHTGLHQGTWGDKCKRNELQTYRIMASVSLTETKTCKD